MAGTQASTKQALSCRTVALGLQAGSHAGPAVDSGGAVECKGKEEGGKGGDNRQERERVWLSME
jgi:hypothetical protein